MVMTFGRFNCIFRAFTRLQCTLIVAVKVKHVNTNCVVVFCTPDLHVAKPFHQMSSNNECSCLGVTER